MDLEMLRNEHINYSFFTFYQRSSKTLLKSYGLTLNYKNKPHQTKKFPSKPQMF